MRNTNTRTWRVSDVGSSHWLFCLCVGPSLGSRVVMEAHQHPNSIKSPNVHDNEQSGPRAVAVSATPTQDTRVPLRSQALLCAATSTVRHKVRQETKQALCTHPQPPETLLQYLGDTAWYWGMFLGIAGVWQCHLPYHCKVNATAEGVATSPDDHEYLPVHGRYLSDGGAVLHEGSWCLDVGHVVGPWDTWKA